MDHLRKLIREVPDFPKAGINFYDITTLLKDAEGLKQTIDALGRAI
jgi:adenine phosphoribosyltransferase